MRAGVPSELHCSGDRPLAAARLPKFRASFKHKGAGHSKATSRISFADLPPQGECSCWPSQTAATSSKHAGSLETTLSILFRRPPTMHRATSTPLPCLCVKALISSNAHMNELAPPIRSLFRMVFTAQDGLDNVTKEGFVRHFPSLI